MPEFGEEDPWFDDDDLDYEESLLTDAEDSLANEIERRGCIRPHTII